MASRYVFDVTSLDFQTAVLERSVDVPILLDFWADWCGPCKSFGPVLEQVAEQFGGAFLAGKVDTEAEPELAQAFRVQSIPFCVLLQGGRPVDALPGAVPASELIAFLGRHGIRSMAQVNAEAQAKTAAEDPDSPQARLERARAAATAGDTAGVRAALADFPEEGGLFGEAQNLLAGLPFLETDFPTEPAAAGHLQSAGACFRAGRLEEALQAIVDSAREDRDYGNGMARRAMLLCQAVAGPQEDLVDDYRRQLATLLY